MNWPTGQSGFLDNPTYMNSTRALHDLYTFKTHDYKHSFIVRSGWNVVRTKRVTL